MSTETTQETLLLLRRAINVYGKQFNEESALLQAGCKPEDVTELQQNPQWRQAVAAVNGVHLGKAVRALEAIIDNPKSTNTEKINASKQLAEMFMPGNPDEKPALEIKAVEFPEFTEAGKQE